MKKFLAIAALMAAALWPAAAQEPLGTTTGGPLTVAGVPIYGIRSNGELDWYFHQGAHNGTSQWAGGGQPRVVGRGWTDRRLVFRGDPTGADGVIYRADSKGDLWWYRHLGHATGAAEWIEGKKVGHGWQDVQMAFAAGGGVIYAIDSKGDLLWFRHLGYGDGTGTWANGGIGAKVGSGWGEMRFVFSGGNGIVYAIDGKGDLLWYRHEGWHDGKFAWTGNAARTPVGNGWSGVTSVISAGNGLIYAVKPNGSLYWYEHTGFRTGAVAWTPPGNGNLIGSGWEQMLQLF